MSKQTLKFVINGIEYKMFFRYPDRKKKALTQEQRNLIKLEEIAIKSKEEALKKFLKETEGISLDDVRYSFRRTEPTFKRSSGPTTTEFYIVYSDERNNEGKAIYKEFNTHSSVRYDTSSKKRSYEKGRQYAIFKYLEQNKIAPESEVCKAIERAYNERSETAIALCHSRDEIEKL